MARVACPGCRAVLEVPAGAAVRFTCGRCRMVLRLPAAASRPNRRSAAAAAGSWRQISAGAAALGVAALVVILVSGGLLWSALRDEGTPQAQDPRPGVAAGASPVVPPAAAPVPPTATRPAPAPDRTPVATPPPAVATDPPKPPPAADPPPEKLVDRPPAPAPERVPPKPRDYGGAVVYPADGQTGVPLVFPGNEQPNPLPEARGRVAGYPVTVTFPAGSEVRDASITLTGPDGAPVAAWVSTPKRPANPKHAGAQQNTVCLFSRSPLRPGTPYAVAASAAVGGKPWSAAWSFTTAREEDAARDLARAVLDRLNAARKAAGLGPLAADDARSRACAAHARFLARNLPARPLLDWRGEDADLPGYTAEGREVARTACIRVGGGSGDLAEWLLASFFNRHLVLDPSLRSIGIGQALQAAGGGTWVVSAGSDRADDGTDEPVLYPAPDQRGVPTSYPANETPSPVPADRKGRPAGYAVTARFPRGTTAADVTARLRDADGNEIEAWVSSPGNPAVANYPQHWVCVLPKAPLHEGAAYTVTMSGTVGVKPWRRTWGFATESGGEARQAEFAAAALGRLNASRRLAGLRPVRLDAELSRGCLAHARYAARNAGRSEVQGLGVHEEDPALPGYTPEGARAGPAAVIAVTTSPLDAVDNWLATLYHRVPLLNPDLERVGFGCARRDDQHWVPVLDARGGVSGGSP